MILFMALAHTEAHIFAATYIFFGQKQSNLPIFRS